MVTLLAPAGSPEALTTAIDAGADAVYVGLKGWSRGGARGELAPDELAAAARLGAARGAEIQVALNTIPKVRARAELLDRIPALRADGIRTFIVNDIGTLAALRRRYPELSLTASIGCGARSEADIRFFRDIGADAVVLPGTLSPAEAEACCRAAGGGISVELMLHMVEEFILLGRCWMPSYLHLRPTPMPDGIETAPRQTGSVKRGGVGACFRICQEAWRLEDGSEISEEQLLPSRQISRLTEVGDYLAAGVDILKLQGRSLPPVLLGLLVARYRRAIDAALVGEPVPATGIPELPPSWTVVGR
jgi:putative protease